MAFNINNATFGGKSKIASIPPLLPITYTANGSVSSAASSTTYTFPAVSFGVANSTRMVVVAIHGTIAASVLRFIETVTIGGVAATIAVIGQGGLTTIAAFAYAAVPTGTSGDVVVTFSGSQNAAGLYSWSVYDATSNAPYYTDIDAGTGINPLSVHLSAPQRAVCLTTASLSATTLRTAVWAGITERYDQALDSPHAMTGADNLLLVPTEADATVTASGSVSRVAACSLVWI